MMSKEKRRVPKLRFPGFTEDWEQRKLGSIGSTYTGLSGKTKEDFGHGEAQYITYLNVFQNTISNITMTDKVEIDPTQNEVKYGDVLFTTSSETPEEVGMSSVWLGDTPNIYLNSFCFGFRPNQKIDSYFLGYSLRAPYMRDKIKILAQGISRYNISKNKVMELEISLPKNEEQKLLGTFLQRIDLIITLHQRKLDNLKLKKKALLQKLFPKNGERYPELRFPGFTDAWEQRKLGGDLIQYTEITTQNNQYPVLTSSRKGLFFQTDYYDGNQIASKDNTGYNIVPYGYFTYRHMSDDEIFHFNINYIVDKGIVSTLYPVFTTKNLNSNFLQLQLNYGNEFKKYAVLLKQGGSRTYMYFNKLKNLNLTISTSIDEQEIIAKFFILFEKLITLHQRKLEHLQLQKKALLQQLFI